MHEDQSRRNDVIVVSDDSDDESFDSDYGEVDWDDINENNMEVVLNNHSPLLQQNLFHPHEPQQARNDNEDRPELLQRAKSEFLAQVYAIFPNICPDYLDTLYNESGHEAGANAAIAAICENMEQGRPYPKRENARKGLKRKREPTAAEEAQEMYGASDRADDASVQYTHIVRHILSLEFNSIPLSFIDGVLRSRQTRHLFQAYKVLEEAEKSVQDVSLRAYRPLLKARVMDRRWTPQNLEQTIAAFEPAVADHAEPKALRELLAARKVREEANEEKEAAKRAEEAELLNTSTAEREGTMKECGCCFGDCPLNRMVHCNSEEDLHWFCRGCARTTAEHIIGNSRYEITCMSMDGCDAGFSRDQKLEFLDEKSFIALDRNEQEAVLRIAGIENLASCPFCPYAAEYPPVEEDKEFRCQAPDCEKVSCRLCKLETHIPKSCEENSRENGLSIRRQIEEAMTAAMVRTCNKCGTPFVKELGCNKMTCTRNGCGNVQCYVCSKSCSYDHFNDSSRGGKAGNCPLFESVEERHEEEVRKAEIEAIRKVREDHPEYTDEDLRVKVSDNVKQDDERRKAMNPGSVRRPPVPMFHARQELMRDLEEMGMGGVQNLRPGPHYPGNPVWMFGEHQEVNNGPRVVGQHALALQRHRIIERVERGEMQAAMDRIEHMRQQLAQRLEAARPQPVPHQHLLQPLGPILLNGLEHAPEDLLGNAWHNGDVIPLMQAQAHQLQTQAQLQAHHQSQAQAQRLDNLLQENNVRLLQLRKVQALDRARDRVHRRAQADAVESVQVLANAQQPVAAHAPQAPGFHSQLPRFGALGEGNHLPTRQQAVRDMNGHQHEMNRPRQILHRMAVGPQRDNTERRAHPQPVVPSLAPIRRVAEVPQVAQGGGFFQMAAAGANRLGPLGRRAALALHGNPPTHRSPSVHGSPGSMGLGEVPSPNTRPRRRQRSFH